MTAQKDAPVTSRGEVLCVLRETVSNGILPTSLTFSKVAIIFLLELPPNTRETDAFHKTTTTLATIRLCRLNISEGACGVVPHASQCSIRQVLENLKPDQPSRFLVMTPIRKTHLCQCGVTGETQMNSDIKATSERCAPLPTRKEVAPRALMRGVVVSLPLKRKLRCREYWML